MWVFFGLLRPIEYLTLERRDILITEAEGYLLIAVRMPKMRMRGARQQYTRIGTGAVCSFCAKTLLNLRSAERLWPGSGAVWRWRMSKLMDSDVFSTISVIRMAQSIFLCIGA